MIGNISPNGKSNHKDFMPHIDNPMDIHTCSDPETIFTHVKGLYHVAMVEHGLKPHGIALIEKRVEELKNE